MAQVSKHPDEQINVGVDFGPRIPGGLTISSAALVLVTGDVSIGAPSTTGSIVSVRVTGGTAGTTSTIEFKATLSDGEILAGLLDVPVNARNF